MRPEDLVFWLDVLRDRAATHHGVLCRRHADSMVVPRGWTLDDLRDPDLHQFRPPSDESGPIPRRRARRSKSSGHEQLALGVDPEDTPAAPPAAAAEVAAAETVNGDADGDRTDADDDAATPWMPIFDTDDDLDGLLAARSPLLSRAFRGERPS